MKILLKNTYQLIFALTMVSMSMQSTLAESQFNQIQFHDGAANGAWDGGWLYQTDKNSDKDREFLSFSSLQPVVYSEVNLNRNFEYGVLHIINATHENERLNQLGFSTGGLRFDVFTGYGDTTSKIRSQFSSVDPYHFHGGIKQKFEYSGFTVSQKLSNTIRINFAQAKINSHNLEEREVVSMGVSGRAFDLSLIEVDRGGIPVGSAFSMSTNYRGHNFGLNYLKNNNGANYRSFNYSRTHKGKTYSVELRNTENPLFSEKNENRIVFSLGYDFGKGSSRFYATEEDSEEQEKQGGNKSKYLIAGGIIGAGVAVSSGSSSSDDILRLASQNAAAKNVLNEINPVSVAQNREHGGYVFRNADGSFSSTFPVAGGVASVLLPDPGSVVPSGSIVSATYHTHAGPDPRFDNENFSPTDISSDQDFGLDGYLGTPAGAFKFHNVTTGAIVTLGTIAN